MNKSKLVTRAAAVVLTTLVTACTSFAPVYGDRTGPVIETLRFNFASPDNHLEQIIFDRLKVAFPGQAAPGDPVLDVAVRTSSPASSSSDAFAVARPIRVRVDAVVTISLEDQTLFQARRFTDTAYQGGKLTPVNMASRTGAEETAALSTAESLRASILAGYRPAP